VGTSSKHMKSDFEAMRDEELLLRYSTTADTYWLGIVLQRYTTLLLGVAMKYLRNLEHAEDAVQQVCLKVLTQFPKEPVQNFKGWLYIVMRNHCLQILKDQHTFPQENDYPLQLIADENEPIEAEEIDENLLHEALSSLKDHQQQVIRLFYLEEKTYAEIMEITGYNFTQVKSYIQNGKRNLKLYLEQNRVEKDG
jgi:RNA polymerase sigma factor (sigma-70 family)